MCIEVNDFYRKGLVPTLEADNITLQRCRAIQNYPDVGAALGVFYNAVARVSNAEFLDNVCDGTSPICNGGAVSLYKNSAISFFQVCMVLSGRAACGLRAQPCHK